VVTGFEQFECSMVSFLELTEAVAGAVFLLSATCKIASWGSAGGSCREDIFGLKKCLSS